MSNQNSYLEYKGPCPRCRAQGKDTKGDNLGTYNDGHSFCFSCELYIPAPTLGAVKNLAECTKCGASIAGVKKDGICNYRDNNTCPVFANEATKLSRMDNQGKKGIYLPSDATDVIDILALSWLHLYDIKVNEVKENGLLWSDFNKWLIFPYRDSQGNVLAFQARNFHMNEPEPKWKTFGSVDDLTHLIGDIGNSIVVVEDIVSCIKVGRHATAMCLFGSHLSLKRLAMLRNITKEVKFWLDADKYKEAMAFSRKAGQLGLKSKCIYTQQDPKACSDTEIIEALK